MNAIRGMQMNHFTMKDGYKDGVYIQRKMSGKTSAAENMLTNYLTRLRHLAEKKKHYKRNKITNKSGTI